MAIVSYYHTLLTRICALVPRERITRLRTLAWIMSGITYSRSVHLSIIANEVPGRSTKLSKVRRMARWLDNGYVRVRRWYHPVAKGLLEAASRSQPVVRLVIDGTKVSQDHQLLMVALVYRRRALPIAWTWLRCAKGHSGGPVQCALLAYVQQLMPAQAKVIVLGDSEFTPLQGVLMQWGWSYALRQKGSYQVRCTSQAAWQPYDQLVTQPGQCRWFPNAQLTLKHRHVTNLLAYWQPGERAPWLIATDLPSAALTRRHYATRMCVEEMFGDFKAHGFDLERTCLRHFLRLSRLTLAAALLYVWIVAFGIKSIKAGHRRLVDRNDRRDLSVFRIGLDMLRWRMGNDLPCVIPSLPYLC